MLAAGSAGRQAPLKSFRRAHAHKNAVSESTRSLQCRALGLKTYDNDYVASLPWAQPGWRGAFVSFQPKALQAAVVTGVTLLGAVLTYFSVTSWGPWVCANIPLLDRYMKVAPFIVGPFVAVVGVTHFTLVQRMVGFYPPKGTWGFWYLPGTPSFHVYWTGLAEILGGIGLALGAAHIPGLPEWLLPASAFGLFLLVTVVSPSNMYMWTHNSPGPFTLEYLNEQYGPHGAIPQIVHVARGAMQVVLLSTFLGLGLQTL